MSSRWYYQMLMEEFGPVTGEQLRELLTEGTLNDDDLVRRESDEKWIAISAARQFVFTDFGDSANQASVEIGDLSELAFEFEDSGPTTRRAAYADMVKADSLPNDGPSGFPAGAVSGSPLPPQELAAEASAAEEYKEEWFCESLGQIMGPMSFDELIELGKSGALDANDRVKCGKRGDWKSVDRVQSVMRAVAVGSAIEVDPNVISSTTQKRLGDAASATLANPRVELQLQQTTPPRAEPQPTIAAPAMDQPLQTAAAPTVVKSTESDPEKAKPKNSRLNRRKNAKSEEQLLDEIFDDVFNNDSPSTRPVATSLAIGTASSSAPHNSSPRVSTVAAPVSVSSTSAVASLAAMAASQAKSSLKSAGRSFEVNPKAIGILVVVMLVFAGGYYVWQNGLPGIAPNGNGKFDEAGAIKTLNAAMARYKALGANPSDADWKGFCQKTKPEMSALFESVYERAGATPQAGSIILAISNLRRIAGTTSDNKEFIDKNVAEFEEHIAMVMKK